MSKKREITVKSLSSNLLQMKFMKKSVLGAEEDADKLELYNDSDCWAIDPDMTNSRRRELEVTPSFVLCEDLCYGRMSFKGFNPSIEKIMRIKNNELEEGENEEQRAKDVQFAEEYSSVSTIAKKFTKRRDRFKHKEPSKPYTKHKQ